MCSAVLTASHRPMAPAVGVVTSDRACLVCTRCVRTGRTGSHAALRVLSKFKRAILLVSLCGVLLSGYFFYSQEFGGTRRGAAQLVTTAHQDSSEDKLKQSRITMGQSESRVIVKDKCLSLTTSFSYLENILGLCLYTVNIFLLGLSYVPIWPSINMGARGGASTAL